MKNGKIKNKKMKFGMDFHRCPILQRERQIDFKLFYIIFILNIKY